MNNKTNNGVALKRRSFLMKSAGAVAVATVMAVPALQAQDPTPEDVKLNLTAQWYNTLTTGLQLNKKTFQLYQTGNPLPGKSNKELWQMCNAIPPASLAYTFNPAQTNQFFSNYGGVVNSLVVPSNDNFNKTMGKDLDAWNKFKASKSDDLFDAPNLSDAIIALFRKWSLINMDNPGTAKKALGELEQIMNNNVSRAVEAWDLHKPKEAGDPPNFNVTIEDVRAKVKAGANLEINMDSSKSNKKVTDSWATVETSTFFGLIRGSATVRKHSAKMSTSTVKIKANYYGVAPIPVANGNWYTSSAFGNAFENRNNPKVWDATKTVTWDSTFGPKGNMQRVASALQVCAGYTAEITSGATYSQTDIDQINADGGASFWPFYEAKASAGSSVVATRNEDGTMTVKIRVPGNFNEKKPLDNLTPIVIGVDVLPMAQALGAK